MPGTMISKSTIDTKINVLQSRAAAICQACELRLSDRCRGPFCADIIPIVNEIDPLISESLRLQLVEKRAIYRRQPNLPMWQRRLPLLSAELESSVLECAVSEDEALISVGSRDGEHAAPECLPPELWGYSLLQFVFGWDSTLGSIAHAGSVRAPLADLPPGQVAARTKSPVVRLRRRKQAILVTYRKSRMRTAGIK